MKQIIFSVVCAFFLFGGGCSIPNQGATNQTEINLNGKNLNQVPSYVFEKTELQTLDISNNNITGALPSQIQHLKNLKTLKASNNKMTGVPAEIGQLKYLEILDLSNNEITGLPNELGNLKNLKVLDIRGNLYSKQDLEIIQKNLPKDVQILK